MNDITKASRLAELEKTISRGQLTFIEVGNALAEIMEQALYKEKGFGSFAEYTETVWGFKKTYAYQLVNSAKIAESVSAIAEIKTESQARELAKVEPAKRAEVLAKAGAKPTAKAIRAASDNLQGGASVARLAHNQEVAGSIPTPVTTLPQETAAVCTPREAGPAANPPAAGASAALQGIDLAKLDGNDQFRVQMGLPKAAEFESELEFCKKRLFQFEQHLLDADLTGDDLIMIAKEIFKLSERIARVGKARKVSEV